MSTDSKFDKMLISYVEKHPCLYDRTCIDYRDRDRVVKAWLDIADCLESNDDIIKRRWRDLRKSFRKAYKEASAQPSPRTDESKGCIAYPFFNSMLWMVPHLQNKRNCSSSLKKNKCPLHGTLESSVQTDNSQREDISEDSNDNQSVDNTNTSTDSSYFPKQNRSNSTGEQAKGKPKDKENKNISSVSAQTDITGPLKESKNPEPACSCQCQSLINADMNFMLSIISDMQMISQRKKIKFKREVMELLEKYI